MGMEPTVTVEYINQEMAQVLLCKFPDASVYDFDYLQSGIWSPLVPRNSYLATPFSENVWDFSSDRKKPKRFTEGLQQVLMNKFKNTDLKKGLKMKKKKSFRLPATPVQGPTPKKGWFRALRASSNYFKKQRGSKRVLKSN